MYKKLAIDDLEFNVLDLPPHFRQQLLLPRLQIGVRSDVVPVSKTDRLLTSERLEASTETQFVAVYCGYYNSISITEYGTETA